MPGYSTLQIKNYQLVLIYNSFDEIKQYKKIQRKYSNDPTVYQRLNKHSMYKLINENFDSL